MILCVTSRLLIRIYFEERFYTACFYIGLVAD
jgi:hypothetical protein